MNRVYQDADEFIRSIIDPKAAAYARLYWEWLWTDQRPLPNPPNRGDVHHMTAQCVRAELISIFEEETDQ